VDIAPLVYPGSFLEGDPKEAYNVQSLLFILEHELTDAALSLDMFMKAYSGLPSFDMDAQIEKSARRLQIENEIATERGVDWFDLEGRGEVRTAADLRLLEEMNASGTIPGGYRSRLPFVHAKSFLRYRFRSEDPLDDVPLVSCEGRCTTSACRTRGRAA
jgi:hypothetical protein